MIGSQGLEGRCTDITTGKDDIINIIAYLRPIDKETISSLLWTEL